jgi:magnesium-transporting ATPase (P-type)
MNDQDEPDEMTEAMRHEILGYMDSLAAQGLRILALASRPHNGSTDDIIETDRDEIESDLVFRGLVGIYDPPRVESAPAVQACHDAGISVHMLTGDYPGTAKAIAEEVGILPTRLDRLGKDVAGAAIMLATVFDAMSDTDIDALPILPFVIARCTPSTKVRMIKALHRRKKFVAMVTNPLIACPYA